MSSSSSFLSLRFLAFCGLIALLPVTGCKAPVNNNQEFDTALAKVTRLGNMYEPMGSQTVGAVLVPNSGSAQTINGTVVQPAGDQSDVSGTTSAAPNSNYVLTYASPWPTSFIQDNMYMPAYWTVSFTPNRPCYDPNTPPTASAPYTPLPSPQTSVQQLLPGVGSAGSFWAGFSGDLFQSQPAPPPTPIPFTCFINTPANPQISPTGVLPRFALDDALPASIQEAADLQINAPASETYLHIYAPDMSVASVQVASSVDPSGMSATFGYPTGPNNTPLPAGAYVSAITTDVPGQTETTNSLEPIVIGHDSQTYPGAFGVAYVHPQETISRYSFTFIRNVCIPNGSTTVNIGYSGPMVTSITQGLLYLPNNTTVAVGTNPTVVIPLNYTTTNTTSGSGTCVSARTSYSGAQSALVVNTGSNSVQVVEIGQQAFPAGTIAVGQTPVAAVVAPSGLIYVANYGSGTISEVNTTTLQQTRTLAVMANPTSLAFDASGNLWVGGQGYVDEVSIPNWTVTNSTPVDGTINQMGYSSNQNAMVQILLQNGTVTAPSNGNTMAHAIVYGAPQSSYSTVQVMNTASGTFSNPTLAAADNAAYIQSPIAAQLAFPAQTAFVPATLSGSGITWPAISSVNGDVVAVANGNTFTVSSLPSGEPIIGGTLPYPIRGVAVGGDNIYFTMPESNSVVTLPMKF